MKDMKAKLEKLLAEAEDCNLWSAQEFVDTELSALCVRFKYVETDAAKMAMPPGRIVE